jgi:hypothetical protein
MRLQLGSTRRAFVSSTTLDLAATRHRVAAVLQEVGLRVLPMEDFPALPHVEQQLPRLCFVLAAEPPGPPSSSSRVRLPRSYGASSTGSAPT